MNICAKCGEEEKKVPEQSGTTCSTCHLWYHMRCSPAQDCTLGGEPVVCEKCTITEEQAEHEEGAFGIYARSHSTMLQPAKDASKDLLMRIKELEEALKREKELTAAARKENIGSKGQQPHHVVEHVGGAPSSAVGGAPSLSFGGAPCPASGGAPSTSFSFGNSQAVGTTGQQQSEQRQHQNDSSFGISFRSGSNASLERSQWRLRLPKEVLRRSQAPAPLTKDQLSRRKTMNTVLPKFDGNPLKYLTFVSAFLETTGDVCGFTPSEEMRRLEAALEGRALDLVRAQMGNVDNLDGIMATLQLSFGETHLILATMTDKVNRMGNLKEDLSNVAVFAGQVDHLRSINNMIDGQPQNLELIRNLERKLPLRYAEEWFTYKAMHLSASTTHTYQSPVAVPVSGNINDLADFLLYLHERSVSLGRNLPSFFDDEETERKKQFKPKKSPMLHVNKIIPDSPATNTVVVVPTTSPPTNNPKCVFKCGKNKHSWNLCSEFKKMSVSSRWYWTKRYRKCFICFGDHQQERCTSTAVCNVDSCGKRHNPLLHPVGVPCESAVHFAHDRSTTTLFRSLPVIIKCGQKERKVLLLMDSGSSVTLMESRLAEELGLTGVTQPLALSWTDGEVQPALKSKVLAIELMNPLTREVFKAGARTYTGLSLPANRVSQTMLVEEGLNHLPISCYEEEKPLLLLGQDNAALMRTISSTLGVSDTIIASETPLGYVVEGERSGKGPVCLVTNVSSDRRMETMLREYINGEHFGLQPDSSVVPESDEVIRARRIMDENTVRREDGRYETGLLWQDEEVNLPENRELALKRHRHFEQKLAKNPVVRERIQTLMESHLANGYVREAVNETARAGRIWYLPIFNVHNPVKPDKVRIVFDGAATYQGASLNRMLLSGPDLTVPLVNVLLRFRTRKVAVSADLQDMFHRVLVKESDRCSQRFVWRANPLEELKDYELCVLTFGATCSPSLAQHVKNINAVRFEDTYPAAVEAILKEHYIDDWLGGGHTEEEVLKVATEVRDIHAEAGFVMHKWMSNSDVVLRGLGEPTQGSEVNLSNSTILGMIWNTVDDTLAFHFRGEKFRAELLDGTDQPTKREMLSVVMGIYDPLGLVSYLTVEGKIILREAWREQAGWDDKLGGGIQRRWAEWTTKLAELKDVVFPRWNGTGDGAVELHAYVDASETSIACAVYVVQRINGVVNRSLIMAKNLVAPILTKSIPKLELDGAMLGVRVTKIVKDAIPWTVEREVYWTDAKDVLYWLRSCTRRYTPYVANRVADILKLTTVEQWRWTPTDLNPADWATKWSDRAGKEALWWRGPEYSEEVEEQWPDCVLEPKQLLEIRPLLNIKEERVHHKDAVLVPDVNRFSRWMVFVNSCANVMKFLSVLRKKSFPGPITEEDVRMSEAAIFREIQTGMAKNKDLTRFLEKLSPFEDQNGVLRMRGRAAKSENLPFDARFPIIVTNDHPAVVLLVEYYHRQNGHQNTTTVVNELRQKVRMPYMRAVVRRIINKCRLCAIRRAKPIIPQMSALPLCRMAMYMPAFSFVGIDYFGPIDVLVGRRHEKRWGVLSTCLTTRAVYLEIAYSLSTQSCLAVLDSLFTRRGLPLEIHSDNATCFVGAAKEVVGPKGYKPTWRFIPPRCPTMAGAWERLVGVTKRALEGLELARTPTEEAFRRGLVLAERLVNSRPLTEIPVDAEEEECLTPNHFLLGSSNGIKPEAKLTNWEPKKSLDRQNEIAKSFWNRWTKEYLPTISARSKWLEKVTPVKVGDLVHLCDDDHQEGWLRGEIVKVFEDGESKQIRQVDVRTADGKTFRRAVSRIAMILSNKEEAEDR